MNTKNDSTTLLLLNECLADGWKLTARFCSGGIEVELSKGTYGIIRDSDTFQDAAIQAARFALDPSAQAAA